MRITFLFFYTLFFNSIVSQENTKIYSLNDVEEFPVFYQIEFQHSQKNKLVVFQAKLQQHFITNMDAKKLIHFESSSPLSLKLLATFDGKLLIENTSDFNNLQLVELNKIVEKLSIKKAAMKAGKEVSVTFSIPLQLKFTEIKTVK